MKGRDSWSNRWSHAMACLFLAVMVSDPEERQKQLWCLAGNQCNPSCQRDMPPLQRDQCAYSKEMDYWSRNFPYKEGHKKLPPQVITTKHEEESDWRGLGLSPHPEPRVILKLEGRPVQFMVDTLTQHSALTETVGPITKKKVWVQRATGMNQYPWTTQRQLDLGLCWVSHSFLVMPDCPYPF